MFQSKHNSITEDKLKQITIILEETITKFPLKESNVTLDLSKQYIPTWANLWNKPNNINKVGKVLAHNNKIAFLVFLNTTITSENMLEHLYLLEDIQEFR